MNCHSERVLQGSSSSCGTCMVPVPAATWPYISYPLKQYSVGMRSLSCLLEQETHLFPQVMSTKHTNYLAASPCTEFTSGMIIILELVWFPVESLQINHRNHLSNHLANVHPLGSSQIQTSPTSCWRHYEAGTATGINYSCCWHQADLCVICRGKRNQMLFTTL